MWNQVGQSLLSPLLEAQGQCSSLPFWLAGTITGKGGEELQIARSLLAERSRDLGQFTLGQAGPLETVEQTQARPLLSKGEFPPYFAKVHLH